MKQNIHNKTRTELCINVFYLFISSALKHITIWFCYYERTPSISAFINIHVMQSYGALILNKGSRLGIKKSYSIHHSSLKKGESHFLPNWKQGWCWWASYHGFTSMHLHMKLHHFPWWNYKLVLSLSYSSYHCYLCSGHHSGK